MEEVIQINSELVNLREDLEKKNREVESLNNKLARLTKETNQFTYIVSHDLQAPLRMVTGFLDLLGKKYGDKLDGSAKEYIDYAVKGASKMRSLVIDLLEYSRLNPNNGEFAEVDLDLIMKEAKEKYQSLIEETGAVISSDHLPVIRANKKQMAQLFQHLLENALKFRSTAVPEINITLKKENACLPDRHGFWVIGIKDNGISIDPAFAEKIFIIFRRLHNDEAGYGGTGIGLALCKKITELHGGEIWVEPAGENGNIFYFSLPVRA